LREITAANGIVLIFDEVITGFRVGYGGAQQLYNIKPDLTCLGKIIGGGLPVGAYGGRAEIMRLVAPEGPMYQAGTLSGNPLAVTAGITTLKMLRARGVYNRLEKLAAGLCEGISRAAARAGVNIITNRVGSMFTTFFAEQPVYDYATAKTSHTDLYSRYFWHMLNAGIYLAPSQFEASFVSLAHTERDIERTIRAAAHALLRVSNDE
jgi:glutamate-1-semialdehyde 2,1-aminomutase